MTRDQKARLIKHHTYQAGLHERDADGCNYLINGNPQMKAPDVARYKRWKAEHLRMIEMHREAIKLLRQTKTEVAK